MLIRRVLLVAAAGALVSCGEKEGRTSPPPAVEAAASAAGGIELSAIDSAVRPGADFYRFANGKWLSRARIPDDHSSLGAVTAMAERAEAQVRAALEKASSAAPGSDARKAADFYAAYFDIAAIDAKALSPVSADFAYIAALANATDLMAAFGRRSWRTASPFGIRIDADTRRPERYAVYIGQGGLGLPDRDYYSEDKHAGVRAQYEAYVARLMRLAGLAEPEARAAQIVALEARLAAVHWEPAKQRNRYLTYNVKTLTSLKAYAPGVDWDAFLSAAGVAGQREFVLAEDEAVRQTAALVASTPIQLWRDYLAFHLLDANADVLPHAIDKARQEFFEASTGRRPENDRSQRALGATGAALGDAVAALYMAEALPPADRAKIARMTINVREAFDRRLAAATWMSVEARKEARTKLGALGVKIGGPVKHRDYSTLEISRNDAYGNSNRAAGDSWRATVSLLDHPVDRDRWHAAPQTVDAFYDPSRNEVVLPAAVLRPPLFDAGADDAVNYGAIGALMAHEMSHGFDDDGSRSDGSGVLRSWWTRDDAASFRRRAERLETQYAAFESAPGLAVDASSASRENVGDLVGLAVAYDAYRTSLGDREAPVIGGLTGDQRFFLSWAQIWRRAVRDDALHDQAASGLHAPAAFHVNGVVRNIDSWYAAFSIGEGDALYLPPSERVQIW